MGRGALLDEEGRLKTDWFDRLNEWRRFGAELAEVMACLHGQDPPIIYRDLKPDNVLMRRGRDGQLHVCLTDFGFAKQPTLENPLRTAAGNGLTAAPEVPRPYGPPKPPYTEQVDNWSLGKTLLCMLWCTYQEEGQARHPWVPEAALWEREDDPRVPPVAAQLIKRLTQLDPSMRGTMQEACMSPFFTTGFTHLGREFQPVQMQALKDAARR